MAIGGPGEDNPKLDLTWAQLDLGMCSTCDELKLALKQQVMKASKAITKRRKDRKKVNIQARNGSITSVRMLMQKKTAKLVV